MVSSTLKAAGCLLFACSVLVHAQQPAQQPTRKATSTISGKVTLKGKGLPGIFVVATLAHSDSRRRPPLVATTDSQGNYRIANVPPGTYEILPGSRQFVVTGLHSNKTLIVGEDETFENIDFALIRGGAISGRITNSEGQPIIMETVAVFGPEGARETFSPTTQFVRTDDRGIYRAFGLAPGKYRVSAGKPEEWTHLGRADGLPNFKQVFYGATTDPAKATLVELAEGGEANKIDITLRQQRVMFAVSGRIVDAGTGGPKANVPYGLTRYRGNGSSSSGGKFSNRQGEFRFDDLLPGRYAIYVQRSPDLDLYAEPVKFEITDQDIEGLVIKVSAGSSVSGVIVLEGADAKAAAKELEGMVVWVHTSDDQQEFSGGGTPMVQVNADGSFRINGVRPGIVKFGVFARSAGALKRSEITRIERNGVEARVIEITDNEQISGVRLIVKHHQGGIRGVVKIENADLLVKGRVQLTMNRVGDESFQTSVQLDSRGRFFVEGLKPGVYELMATAFVSDDDPREPPSVIQQVVVVADQVSEVTLTLDVGPKR